MLTLSLLSSVNTFALTSRYLNDKSSHLKKKIKFFGDLGAIRSEVEKGG
jgi:hypothetical protein